VNEGREEVVEVVVVWRLRSGGSVPFERLEESSVLRSRCRMGSMGCVRRRKIVGTGGRWRRRWWTMVRHVGYGVGERSYWPFPIMLSTGPK
jgi:hypothetical protein